MEYKLERVDTGNGAYELYDVSVGGENVGQINRSNRGFPEIVGWDWHCQPHGFGQAYKSKKHAVEGLLHYRGMK